jgi:hypothetical protein
VCRLSPRGELSSELVRRTVMEQGGRNEIAMTVTSVNLSPSIT